jgi:hypothetical protein
MKSPNLERMILFFMGSLCLSACGGGSGTSLADSPEQGVNLEPHISAPAPTAAVSCPMGSAYDDGCAGAGHVGTVEHPVFFQHYAPQSGQTFITRPPWNVAGVEYAVGVYTPIASLLDPTVAANLPVGCVYATGAVNCSGTGSVDIAGFDFSLHGGITLYIHNTYTGTCTVEDNNFLVTAATDAAAPLVRIDGAANTCSHLIQWNTFDGNYDVVTDGLTTYLLQMSGSPSWELVWYNGFLHCPQKCVAHAAATNVITEYNYAEGFEHGPSHGEFALYNTGANVNISSVFNTILQPANVPVVASPSGGVSGVAAVEFVSSGQVGPIQSATLTNNVIVVNTQDGTASGPASVAVGIGFAYSTYGYVTLGQNYMDPTGIYNCYHKSANATITGTQPTFSGDVNLLNSTGLGSFTVACVGKSQNIASTTTMSTWPN